ncbi:FecR family protein [Pedobacter steynii]|uniref:FecR protein n=1 Tax=Pedobacter steynii TaxID=430522 RepID=A0A1D7QKX6_9SPHI|nr:FecR domain-containing protein [Pedobacter steynii]AOM79334.1 hypothetical protein BFS30_20480 [Pedobacter steynii]
MKESDLSKLVSQESFLNYCFKSNTNDVTYWEKWLKENPQHKDQVEEIKTTLLLLPIPAGEKVIDHDFKILKNSIANLNKVSPLKPSIKLWPLIAGITAILAVIVSVILFFNYRSKTRFNSDAIRLSNDLTPGGNKAILTLANGKTINLSDSKSGIVIKATGLTYNDGTAINYIQVKNSEISVIATPRGGQYSIELPDGTTVTLNASSTLKFPSTFQGLVNRTVELAGEGYFQVAHDKQHPFLVKSAGQTIEVLGTHFNINSYTDEPTITTTLLEGRVKVSSLHGAREVETILKPGEQSRLNHDGKLLIATVNPEEAIAWKNGYFLLDDDNFQSVMNKISRWYDVEVVYESMPRSLRLEGRISRARKLSAVLNALQETGKVHFKIEGRRVTVID